jgi:hypothetical protein
VKKKEKKNQKIILALFLRPIISSPYLVKILPIEQTPPSTAKTLFRNTPPLLNR